MQDAGRKSGFSVAEIVVVSALLVFFALTALVRF
jgi:hypothetical protein